MTETPVFFASLQNTDRLVWPLTGVAVVPIRTCSPLCFHSRSIATGSGRGDGAGREELMATMSGISRERKLHHLLLGADAHDLFELDVFGRTPDPDVHLVRFHFKSPFGGVPICQNARFQR